MTNRILVEWDSDLPRMWNALLHVLKIKHAEYGNADVTFNKIPPLSQWRFGEPDDASGTITNAYDLILHSTHPTLRFAVENASICAEDGDGELDGFLITLQASDFDVDESKFVTTLFKQYAVTEDADTFQFHDLRQVASPKIEVKTK